MASEQNVCTESFLESDNRSSDNSDSPSETDDDVVKVVVMGEPGCGKTSFIRAYYAHNYPGVRYAHNGIPVYPCKYESNYGLRRVLIFEIPSDPEFDPEQKIPRYTEADVFVFLYAVDDPSSLQRLAERWILEAINIINEHRVPVVFVGTKADLLRNRQVIRRLALANQSPVTLEQASQFLSGRVPGCVAYMECSDNDLQQVNLTFNSIFGRVQLNVDVEGPVNILIAGVP